tara:strand:- start:115 stop:342 length:228 start_codon:yes stop_codon:yes gene_type:complete
MIKIRVKEGIVSMKVKFYGKRLNRADKRKIKASKKEFLMLEVLDDYPEDMFPFVRAMREHSGDCTLEIVDCDWEV